MTNSVDEITQAIAQKSVCAGCICEPYISAEIKHYCARLTCSYCRARRNGINIKELSYRIDLALLQHFSQTSTEPNDYEYMMLSDGPGNYEWKRHGTPVRDVISNMAGVNATIAADLQHLIFQRNLNMDKGKVDIESHCAPSSYYEARKIDSWHWDHEWRKFEEALKTQTRFFSRNASYTLDKIFEDLEGHKLADGRSLVLMAGPGTAIPDLFRARSFQSTEKLHAALKRPDLDLGSPPWHLAVAGRMNAKGIAVFYGSTDPEVALAEVRPPVGAKILVGRFEIIRRLHILDLEGLRGIEPPLGSYFDPAYRDRLERIAFLNELSQRMTRPVMPDDEAFEYLPTQAIADYLAGECDTKLDGIAFPSVQVNGGINVALFNKASKVEELEILQGTEIAIFEPFTDDEMDSPDYLVGEEVSAEDQSSIQPQNSVIENSVSGTEPDPQHVNTLRVIVQDLCVHTLQSIKYNSTIAKVSRKRWESSDLLF